MRYLKLITIFIIILILSGCSIKDYYFPMSELTKGKVYKYECKSEPSKTEYWKLTSNLTENTIITEAFNSEFIQYEFFKEELTKEGSKLLEFISYRTNENGQKEKEIINKPIELDVFKWKTDNPYRYSSEATEEFYGKVMFEKRREFIGEVKVNVLGREYKALKFKGFYKTEVPKTNQKYEYSQFSYYAKGLGLVKMEKEYSDGTKRTLELTEIISNSEWNKRQ
ncbi:hypothetical protein [Winogradskyella sp. PG-2]|uniref:hypothetical protein n=1 Tax=Winogradskyella sp. PG-2 TaxID=754409 RepID=UPI0004587A0B|nr:hypothetical protein [Winogradskyella sp. PG-2]BAO76427.1 hypothetical protein WPG_2197 [Winogradskyella sp. PG-2]